MSAIGASASAVATAPRLIEPLIDVSEVARRLNVPRSWVYERTRRRSIPHVRVGKYIRFRWADVLEWLDEDGGALQ